VLYDCPGALGTFPAAINDSGVITGNCLSNSGNHGFIRIGGEIIVFDPRGSTDTSPMAINDRGTITGSYFNSTGVRQHGFVLQLDDRD
jgi:hypothetical protein